MLNSIFLLFPRFPKASPWQLLKVGIMWEKVNPFPHNDTFLTRLGKKPFENIVRKREIACAISPFSTMFSTVSKTEIIIFVSFNLLSANAFNLVWSKILCGNGLKHGRKKCCYPDFLLVSQCFLLCPEQQFFDLHKFYCVICRRF